MVATTTETRTEKGVSLARGPALIVGTILLAVGLYAIYKEHTFLPFSNFPNGDAPAEGKVFGIFAANGWTGMLTAVCGSLLLFGAAQHLLAKTMSLIVGVALGAAAIIALISGNVLGMAAANGWTELAWGIAAAILLLNSLIPRRRRTVVADEEPGVGAHRRRGAVPAAEAGTAAGAGATAGAAYEHHRVTHERVADDRAVARDRTAADDRTLAEEPTVADDRTGPGERAVGEERTVADDRTVPGERTVSEERTVARERPVSEDPTVASDQAVEGDQTVANEPAADGPQGDDAQTRRLRR